MMDWPLVSLVLFSFLLGGFVGWRVRAAHEEIR